MNQLKITIFCIVVVGLAYFLGAQEQKSIPAEIIATTENPQITTVHTGFAVKNIGVRRAILVKEEWTPEKIERYWLLPVVYENNQWVKTEEAKEWVEIIEIKDGKLKLTEKRIFKRAFDKVEYP